MVNETVAPLISIVTVCYNSERYIQQTIESVLQQDFRDYEYIIVDGLSKDRTMEIVKEFEPRFEGRMRWISEPDKGIYDAMNKGIRKAKGSLVWLVNSDDYIQPGALQKVYDTFSTFDKGAWPIISFAYNRVSSDGVYEEKVFFDKSKSEWCAKRDYMGLLHPATIVPNDVYHRHDLYDTWFKIIADLDWFKRMMRSGEPMEFVDIIITNMRDGGASATHYYKDRIKEYRYYCYKNYTPIIATFHYYRLWLQRHYGYLIRKYHLLKQ